MRCMYIPDGMAAMPSNRVGELGGNYGGGYESFAAGRRDQIEPAAAIAPILVTENGLGAGRLQCLMGQRASPAVCSVKASARTSNSFADKTGNVSWMIFTGPEHLAKFDGEAGSTGKYTLYNDPDACLWPVYHWYKEYAGDNMPAASSVSLVLSPRSGDITTDHLMMPGTCSTPAVVASYNGYESQIETDLDVAVDNSSVISWDNGSFHAIGQGQATATVGYTVGGKNESVQLSFTSTAFPFLDGYFNPSIWETGTFDSATHTITTGQYGFAGWKYSSGIDLSEYHYLIAELDGDNNCGLSFRVFDQNNYWSDPAQADFGNAKRAVIDLDNMKSIQGRQMDKSHLYIVGFWSMGGRQFRISNVFPAMTSDASGIDDIEAETIRTACGGIRSLRSQNPQWYISLRGN